jgi:hypothetical protein
MGVFACRTVFAT